MEARLTRQLFQEGKAGERMVCRRITHKPGTTGKRYRVATDDRSCCLSSLAEACLVEKREKLTLEWGIDPVPDEPLPEGFH